LLVEKRHRWPRIQEGGGSCHRDKGMIPDKKRGGGRIISRKKGENKIIFHSREEKEREKTLAGSGKRAIRETLYS